MNRGAEETAYNVAVVDDLIHHALGKIDGNRKTHALIAAAAGKNGGVDADEFALGVDQRAAGIARVDSGVGLDEIFVVLNAEIGAAGGADDAHGDGLADAEGIADGESEIADFYLGRIAERNGGEMVGVDFQHGDVGLGIAADDVGGEFTLVAQGNFDVGGAIDHVIVGEDVAVGADDHAGAEAVFLFLLRSLLAALAGLSRGIAAAIAEELAEERIVEERIRI